MAFRFELVRTDVTAREGGVGPASGDAEAVEHAVAVEEVVGPTWEELRVGAVTDVGAVEARRETADDLALCRRDLVDGGKVSDEDMAWVDRRTSRRIDEGVDEVVDGGEDGGWNGDLRSSWTCRR